MTGMLIPFQKLRFKIVQKLNFDLRTLSVLSLCTNHLLYFWFWSYKVINLLSLTITSNLAWNYSTLWVWQTSLNLAIQPWISAESAQLSYPSDPISTPKSVRKQINYPRVSVLHFHVHPHRVKVISSSLSPNKHRHRMFPRPVAVFT